MDGEDPRQHRSGMPLAHHVRHAPSMSWHVGEACSANKMEFLRQYHIKSDNDRLDAKGARRRRRELPPCRTPVGEKRMLSNWQGELPLAHTPIGHQFLAPIDSTNLSDTGTRRYIPSVGPSTRRSSVGHRKKAHYQSTAMRAQNDYIFQEAQPWSEEQTSRLNDAVEVYGSASSWQRVSMEVGGGKGAYDCRRQWEDQRRSRSSLM